MGLLCAFLWSARVTSAQAGEDASLPPYKWSAPPRYPLWTDHRPLPGWRIERVPKGTAEVFLRESGRQRKANGVPPRLNPCLKGIEEDLFLLHFDYAAFLAAGGPPIEGMEADPKPVFLGWDYHDFSTRYRRWTGERGLYRQYVIANQFGGIDAEPLDVPTFGVDPASSNTDRQRLLMPLVAAEGSGDYMVLNAFDRAGMTAGFSQMAAHTPDDLVELMKHLLQDESLCNDPYANPGRWFPELAITTDGQLSYRASPNQTAELCPLEGCTSHRNANEGFSRIPGWAYYREDFVRFCNPDLRAVDSAELHFAARWLMWSLSPQMRAAQVEPTCQNVERCLRKLALPQPEIRADAAAVAAVILYWNDGAEYRKRVAKLLAHSDPVAAFLSLESRPGDPKAAMCGTDLICKNPTWLQLPERDRQVLNRRVESVRLLFEERPSLRERLRKLNYRLADGALLERPGAEALTPESLLPTAGQPLSLP